MADTVTPEQGRSELGDAMQIHDDGTMTLDLDASVPVFYADCADDDVAAARKQISAHSAASFGQPLPRRGMARHPVDLRRVHRGSGHQPGVPARARDPHHDVGRVADEPLAVLLAPRPRGRPADRPGPSSRRPRNRDARLRAEEPRLLGRRRRRVPGAATHPTSTARRRHGARGASRSPSVGALGLDRIAGLDVLEFGCGAAQWSTALAPLGARVRGLDQSIAQLGHARRRIAAARTRSRSCARAARPSPFADASFDLVFCDHGALSFCDPNVAVPECARLLRDGGRLVFCLTTPLVYLTYDAVAGPPDPPPPDRGGRRSGGSTPSRAPSTSCGRAGAWIRVFRRHGFEVDDLIELVPPKGATTTYTDFVPVQVGAPVAGRADLVRHPPALNRCSATTTPTSCPYASSRWWPSGSATIAQ